MEKRVYGILGVIKALDAAFWPLGFGRCYVLAYQSGIDTKDKHSANPG